MDRKVIVMKLITGDEVIGDLTEKIGDANFIKNPFVLRAMVDDEGKVRGGLSPFFMSSDKADVVITADKIVAQIDAPADLERAYLTQVSGIQLASAIG